MLVPIHLILIILCAMPTRTKGPRPNGSRYHRPWTTDEILQHNRSTETGSRYVQCAQCGDIRCWSRYKNHYMQCADIAMPDVLPYYELSTTQSPLPEWEYRTKTNTRKRKSNSTIKSHQKAKKAKYSSFWSSFGIQSIAQNNDAQEESVDNGDRDESMDDIAPEEQTNGEIAVQAEEKEEVSEEEMLAVKDIQRLYKITAVNRAEFIQKCLIDFISYLTIWIQAIESVVIFENNLSLLAIVFDMDLHLIQLQNITNAGDRNAKKALYREYIDGYGKDELLEVLVLWNAAYTVFGYGVEQQTFEVSFKLFKTRMFNLHRKNLLLVHFEHNKKEYFKKYNVNIIKHNEIFRLFRKTRALYTNIEIFMLVWTRADVMGCSEGRVEGDVKCGDERLHNRYRLKPHKFRQEHTIRDILRVLPLESRKEIQSQTAKILSNKPGAIKKVLYVTNRVNPEHYPSKSIGMHRRPAQIKTVTDAQLQGIDEDIFQDGLFDDLDDDMFPSDDDVIETMDLSEFRR